ncbi:twin-arginine translocation signal domain-containing protein, partial [Streptomyces poonensis]
MSRIRSAVSAATAPDRRAFLAAAGAVTLSAGIGLALRSGSDAPAAAAAEERTVALSSRRAPAAPLAPYTRGTTLGSVAAPRGGTG